ncbi:DUF2147 domain-containing protein [Pedobacter sp. CCM 8938]|uniref:DUF2147 domain-containing protein n=2 Tax=Pedobacter fastidiosus TaxID=2765361 RepID=A0ABR7KWM9_9SPHI|nr:DUF2147 domain-containing protein [Pedobacter fastidiosus]MBC6112461.1 DUF2147 domain-containing protein [Pedobacter fastidiosus]
MSIPSKQSLASFLLIFSMQVSHGTRSTVCSAEDQILGDWLSLEKNVVVNISKEGRAFKATVMWFTDKDIISRPMESRCDSHNPNPQLRKRKLLGMEILSGLNYNPSSGRWEDGLIYDPLSGRDWSSVVSLERDGILKVKGYWHFEFLSKSVSFKRIVFNRQKKDFR